MSSVTGWMIRRVPPGGPGGGAGAAAEAASAPASAQASAIAAIRRPIALPPYDALRQGEDVKLVAGLRGELGRHPPQRHGFRRRTAAHRHELPAARRIGDRVAADR